MSAYGAYSVYTRKRLCRNRGTLRIWVSATLTSFSGEVEVPGSALHLHLIVFESGRVLPAHRRRDYQPPGVHADTAILKATANRDSQERKYARRPRIAPGEPGPHTLTLQGQF